jgi:hypothetical protein
LEGGGGGEENTKEYRKIFEQIKKKIKNIFQKKTKNKDD